MLDRSGNIEASKERRYTKITMKEELKSRIKKMPEGVFNEFINVFNRRGFTHALAFACHGDYIDHKTWSDIDSYVCEYNPAENGVDGYSYYGNREEVLLAFRG